MLDIKFIRENSELVKNALLNKKTQIDLDNVLKLDEKRRELLLKTEEQKALLNKVNKEIGCLKKNGEPFQDKINEMKDVSKNMKQMDHEVGNVMSELHEILLSIPNMPNESVPEGGEECNEEVRSFGDKREFTYTPKPHWDIAEKLDIVDFKRGAKLSGSGFLLFKKEGARLERALINYFLDTHLYKNGFEEISPPFLVSRNCMTGTGQLPKMEDDMYLLPEEDLFLIPTAEVPVTNIFADEIFNLKDLPRKYVAYSPCFRKEAGSYGKDTRGMVRVHQFDKVEMVAWVKPEESYDMLEILTGYAENLLKELDLPYRVLNLATGDLSFASAKTYDIELWAPGMQKYLEVSSISNFEDFQARRAKIRFRPEKGGKPEFVHTLNGSGLALPRVVIGIIENFQNEDGSITIPKVLQPYMGGITKIG